MQPLAKKATTPMKDSKKSGNKKHGSRRVHSACSTLRKANLNWLLRLECWWELKLTDLLAAAHPERIYLEQKCVCSSMASSHMNSVVGCNINYVNIFLWTLSSLIRTLYRRPPDARSTSTSSQAQVLVQ